MSLLHAWFTPVNSTPAIKLGKRITPVLSVVLLYALCQCLKYVDRFLIASIYTNG
jgi:hypothetical protein